MDQDVVVNGNLVSSRKPDDIPAFNREMIALFGRSEQKETRAKPGEKPEARPRA